MPDETIRGSLFATCHRLPGGHPGHGSRAAGRGGEGLEARDKDRDGGKLQDKDAPSDGYATGLVLYVLRPAGVGATEKSVQRGVACLKANQRESGRWFTRSLNHNGRHYISNAGTAFAILALKACE
jgi:hypothetical protein